MPAAHADVLFDVNVYDSRSIAIVTVNVLSEPKASRTDDAMTVSSGMGTTVSVNIVTSSPSTISTDSTISISWQVSRYESPAKNGISEQ